MSLSTCDNCGGHIPIGPKATNRCDKCGTHVMGQLRYVPAPCCELHREMNVTECPSCVREEQDMLRKQIALLLELNNAGGELEQELREERDKLRSERDNAIAAIEVWQREYQSAYAEVMRLRDLIPHAWSAGQARIIGSHKDFKQTHPTFREWMEQKGLA